MICSYQQTDDPADDKGRFVFRCTNKGCNNSMRATGLDALRPGMCNGPECIHLGEPTDETVSCSGCKGSEAAHAVWTCAMPWGKCVPTVRRTKEMKPNVQRCDGCRRRE